MKYLQGIDRWLNRFEHSVLVLLLTVMVIVAFAQVVLRNLFSTGLFWSEELLRYLVLWLGFIGATLAVSDDKHIHIDALRHYMPKSMRRVVDVLTHLFAVYICYEFAKAGWTFVKGDIESKTTLFHNVPSWTVQIVIPVGFALLALHFLLRTIINLQAPATETAAPPSEVAS